MLKLDEYDDAASKEDEPDEPAMPFEVNMSAIGRVCEGLSYQLKTIFSSIIHSFVKLYVLFEPALNADNLGFILCN